MSERIPSFFLSAGLYAVASIAIGYLFGPMEESASGGQKGGGFPSGRSAPPGNRLRADENRRAEEILQRMMQEFTTLTHSKRIPEAQEKAEEILEFTAKTWGKQSMNYGLLLGIPVAQLYELTEDVEKMEKCLKEAYTILQVHGPDFIAETGIADKLAALYSNRGNHTEAAKYALSTLEIRTAIFKTQPSKEAYGKYCSYIVSVGTILSNSGLFRRTESTYKEAISIGIELDPGSNHFYLLLEAYSNILHQQGKTLEAINRLDEYSAILIKNAVAGNNTRKIFQRMAVLYFTIDKFNECLNEIERFKSYSEQKKLTLNLQILCELASVYWELNRAKEAQDTQQQMKGLPLVMGTTSPLARSRYLATIECHFQKAPQDQVIYHLLLRVNRELPLRKENDPVEDPTTIPRRLESCFLVITFESTVLGGEPVRTTCLVTKANLHSFEVKSPAVPVPDPGKLYEVAFEVYDNENKEKLLGTHHQLILSTPPSFRFNTL